MRLYVGVLCAVSCGFLALAAVLINPVAGLSAVELAALRGQQIFPDSECITVSGCDCTLFWVGGNQCVGRTGQACYRCYNTTSRFKFCLPAIRQCKFWAAGEDGSQPCGAKLNCLCWTDVLCGSCTDSGTNCGSLDECM